MRRRVPAAWGCNPTGGALVKVISLLLPPISMIFITGSGQSIVVHCLVSCVLFYPGILEHTGGKTVVLVSQEPNRVALPPVVVIAMVADAHSLQDRFGADDRNFD